MARNDRERKRSPKDLNRRPGKKKVCIFCKDRIQWVDYKDVNLLKRYQSDRGKIRARRVSGNCSQHQREVAVAIKTARELALLPYTQRTVLERSGRPGRPPMRERRDAPGAGDGLAAPVPGVVPTDGEAVVPELDVDVEAGAVPEVELEEAVPVAPAEADTETEEL